MDSKFQFRDASPPPTAWAPSFRAGEWRLLEPPKQLYRFAEADDRSGDSPAPTVDRGKRVGPLDQHPDRPRSAPSRGSRRSGPSCSIRQSTTQSRGSRWNVGTALQLIRSIVQVTRGILGSSRPSSTPIFALIRAPSAPRRAGPPGPPHRRPRRGCAQPPCAHPPGSTATRGSRSHTSAAPFRPPPARYFST